MPNVQIKAIVVSVSDTRVHKNDISGDTLVALLASINAEVIEKIIVSDDLEVLRNTLYVLTETKEVNLIVTTGGIGAHHDVAWSLLNLPPDAGGYSPQLSPWGAAHGRCTLSACCR